jgi:hypothetical protein
MQVFAYKITNFGQTDMTFGLNGYKQFITEENYNASNIMLYQNNLLLLGNSSPNLNIHEFRAVFMLFDTLGNPVSTFGDGGFKKITLAVNGCLCGERFKDFELVGNELYYIRSRGDSFGGFNRFEKINLATLPNSAHSTHTNYVVLSYVSVYSKFKVTDNKLYIMGCFMTNSYSECLSTDNGFKISRRQGNGNFDTTFNSTGMYNFNFPTTVSITTYDNPLAFAIDQGTIVMAGYKRTPSYVFAPDTGFAILRLIDETLLSTTNQNKSLIKVYPNPFNHTLNLDIPNDVVIQAVTVVDIMGKTVYNQLHNHTILDMSSLQAGMYVIHINTSTGSYHHKIIKK